MTDVARAVDQALSLALRTVCQAALDRGIDGADVRTTLVALNRGGLRDVLEYSYFSRSWVAGDQTERFAIRDTLRRIAKAAAGDGDEALSAAASQTGDLVDKYRPASYDDVRSGIEAADKLLSNLGYDEPSVKKAKDSSYSPAWWTDAARAMKAALNLLDDDSVRASLPEGSRLQLDSGLEELRLLYASLELDPRVRKEDTDTHSEASESELDVIRSAAPETQDHVEEADALLTKVGQPQPEENVLQSGQTSESAPPPSGTVQNALSILRHADMSEMMFGRDAVEAQVATGQRIADALWGGFAMAQDATGWALAATGISKGDTAGTLCDALRTRLEPAATSPHLRAGLDLALHSLESDLARVAPGAVWPAGLADTILSLAQAWQATDPTGGQWDHHGEPDPIISDDSSGGQVTAHLKDWHPDGTEGHALEPSIVSRGAGIGEQRQHVPSPQTFHDGPLPAEGPDHPAESAGTRTDMDSSGLGKTTPNVVLPVQDGFQDGGPGQPRELRGHGPHREVGNDTDASAHVMKAPSEDGMAAPTHLQETPAVSISRNAKTIDQHPRGTGAAEQDQRGADVNPLNLAQGDEDVRALGRLWKSLFRQAVSDPSIRLAFFRKQPDESEYEIDVD